MSRVLLCVAALVVAAAAWPSNTFFKVDRYTTNALCTAAGTPTGTTYYALDLCTVASTSGNGISTKYSQLDANTIQYWSFTGTTCAAGQSLFANYTVGGCGASGLNRATVLSSSVGMYSVASYTSTDCSGTASSGPSFSMQGCTSGVQITVGGKLEVCVGTATDCSGDSTCASISHSDSCVDGSSQGGSGSLQYDWNAASSATPAVALTAALIAVVAAVTKF